MYDMAFEVVGNQNMQSLPVSRTFLSRFFIWMTMLALIFDIGGGFGLKYAVLALVLVFFLIQLITVSFPSEYLVEFLLVSVFVSLSLFSVLRGNSVFAALPELSFFFFLILLLVGKGAGHDFFTKMFLALSLLASLLIISTFVLILFVPDLALEWARFAQSNRMGYIGIRPLAGGVPNVYFRWTAWLVLGLSLAIFNKKHFTACLIFFASLLTMSSAIVFGQLLVLTLYCTFSARLSPKVILSRIFGFVLIFIFLYVLGVVYPEISENILSKLSSESISTSIKIGHISSIISLLIDNPLFLFFGQGPGTIFYSKGVDTWVSNVEVSHFNLIRQFGIVGLISYVAYFFFVVMRLSRLGWPGYSWITGLLVMFLVAGTNPLLLSPIFFVPLLLARLFTIEKDELIYAER